MKRRWLVGVMSCLAAVAAVGPGAVAAGPSRSQLCARAQLKCFRVSVPLDWSHAVPGKLSLWVQEYVPPGPSRGVMFLLAGGPGQASTSLFQLGQDSFWAQTLPGYTLVDYDPRGTGLSDPLTCHATGDIGCIAQLGPSRDYYRTVDNAMDIDAVRQAIGAPRIGLYGASYGTDLAVIYARMYPANVTRLLLDSVATPTNSVALFARLVKQLPTTLRDYCARNCTGATRAYATDAVALARKMAVNPLRGRVLQPSGGYGHVTIDLDSFVRLLIDSDLYVGFRAELPAAVVAAQGGDAEQLLRLEQIDDPYVGRAQPVENVNAVGLATTCGDGGFPWQADTPVSERASLLATAAGQLPAGSFGAIGPSAIAADEDGNDCAHWPVSTVQAPAVPAAYPNVPVLAISGDLDLRSPTFEDRQLLAHFPRGRLLTVRNTGHAPLVDLESPCLIEAVRGWLAGRSAPATCAAPQFLTTVGSIPESAGTPARALAAVSATLVEAEASWALARGDIGGVAAGRLMVNEYGFALKGYGLTVGIDLDGIVDYDRHQDAPFVFGGVLNVVEHGSAVGTLTLQTDGTLSGTLDGDTVTNGRLSRPRPQPAPKPLANWSTWTPAAGSTARVADEIAAHVGAAYLLRAGGPILDRVAARSAGVRGFIDGGPWASIQIRPGFERGLRHARFASVGSAWVYTLCGSNAYCHIPGTASIQRGRLVQREALELALFTFEFDPGVDSLVIVPPPPPGETRTVSALYFTRSDLARELREPLARTLPLTSPPLPTDPDAAEAARIDGLTHPHDYFVNIEYDGASGNVLVLRRFP